MRAGEVARAAGIGVESLRYYERRGLMPVPDRSLGGHRVYSDADVTRLRVIRAAARLGFTLIGAPGRGLLAGGSRVRPAR